MFEVSHNTVFRDFQKKPRRLRNTGSSRCSESDISICRFAPCGSKDDASSSPDNDSPDVFRNCFENQIVPFESWFHVPFACLVTSLYVRVWTKEWSSLRDIVAVTFGSSPLYVPTGELPALVLPYQRTWYCLIFNEGKRPNILCMSQKLVPSGSGSSPVTTRNSLENEMPPSPTRLQVPSACCSSFPSHSV